MPSRVRCFLLTPTDEVVVQLRRYDRSELPPPAHRCFYRAPRYPGAEEVTRYYHDAVVEIGRETGTLDPSCDGEHDLPDAPHDDPRWPTHCACGYAFTDQDFYGEDRVRLYRRGDTGGLVTISEAPAGALYDHDGAPWKRLMCKTPAGEWMIGHPLHGWSWTGELPDITVTPSIAIGEPRRFHAVLTNGWLEVDQP